MTLNQFYRKYSKDIDKAIASALKEDRVKSDISTQAILKRVKIDRKIEAILLCKEDCIAAGIDIFIKVYKKLDPKAELKVFSGTGNL